MPLIQSPLRISLSFSIEHSVQMCIHAVWAEWYLECKTTTVDLAHLRESNSHLIKIILTFTQQFDWIIPDQFMNAVVSMADNSIPSWKKNQFPKKTIACASNEYDNYIYRGKTSLVLCDAINWTGFSTGSMCVLFISCVRKIHVIARWLYHQNLVQTHNMFVVFYSYKTNVGHPPVFRNLLNQNREKNCFLSNNKLNYIVPPSRSYAPRMRIEKIEKLNFIFLANYRGFGVFSL